MDAAVRNLFVSLSLVSWEHKNNPVAMLICRNIILEGDGVPGSQIRGKKSRPRTDATREVTIEEDSARQLHLGGIYLQASSSRRCEEAFS